MPSLSYIINNPRILLLRFLDRFGIILSDRAFLRCKFKLLMGYKLDLKSPQSYSEKLQWLKLYDRRPEYTKMVDKYAVKEYVASLIGQEYIIPTLGVWDNPEMIEWDILPNQFVLKCTHDSGGVVICKDKLSIDKEAAIKKLTRGLKKNYFYPNREWPYKNVRPRVIAEEYKVDPHFQELRDYKFFCFNGEVKALFIATDRNKGDKATRFDFFDADFNHLPFTNGHPNAIVPPQKPMMFEEMKNLAKILSAGIPHVRIDFYEVGNIVYFGEMTFFHWSGMKPFDPKEWDNKFGEWLVLPDLH